MRARGREGIRDRDGSGRAREKDRERGKAGIKEIN